jgi:hypothetical protein
MTEENKTDEIFKSAEGVYITPIKNIDGTITITCNEKDFNELKYSLTLMNYKRLCSRSKMNTSKPRKHPERQRQVKPYYYFNNIE